MKRTDVLWITTLVLGWIFDFLFWKHGVGINFAIYAVLCLAGGFLVLGMNGIRPSWKSLLVLLPILFFAAMTFIRLEPMSMFLSGAFTLGLMGVLAVTFLGGRWAWYSLSDYVANFARLAGSLFARPLIFLVESRKQVQAAGQAGESGGAARARWKRVWAILRGILIAVPVVAIFAALLSSADVVFAQRLHDFTRLFRLENLPEYIFRAVYILIGAYALAGILLHAALKSKDEKLLGMDKPLVPAFLGFTEATVVLGAVVLLFGAFVIIQFQYFFGGQTNIGVQGYTFSEYARKGFGELVAVAFFSLLLFLGLSAIAKRQSPAQRWTFSGLGLGMVALVGIILVSAFQRLLLYEAAYGSSRLRMYTHVFMIWLGALLAVVVVLDILRRERFFAFAALVASLGFAATLMLANVDGAIVRENVARAAAGESLDVAYLASLSSDAVPAMVQAFQSPTVPARTREAVGAALACRSSLVKPPKKSDWQAFTLSRFWADSAFSSVQGSVDNYYVHQDEYHIRVDSPQGDTFNCIDYSGD
ncbi:MAG TPA: DUF4173 domain-containing protein [Anaerolineales bacterium]|nr:DUF4173 domain-containing protein [Anaerolineales bacterium]